MIHFDRLLKLADFLDTVPPEKFDFDVWCNGGRGEVGGRVEVPDLNVCGTTACALGWATAIPEFQKLGIKLDMCSSQFPCVTTLSDSRKRDSWSNALAAARDVFGLGAEDVSELFTSEGYHEYYDDVEHGWDYEYPDLSVKDVATHIRQWVEDHTL